MNFDRIPWPKEVDILGTSYRVDVVELVDEDGSRGETEVNEKLIKVKRDKKKVMWSTLFHEMAHAWLEESQFTAYLTDDKVEETLVCMIENQFIPALFKAMSK